MGEVIYLDQRRADRREAGRHPAAETAAARGSQGYGEPSVATLWFDLASPYTYLVAERAEALFPGLTWCPVLGGPELSDGSQEEDRRRASGRAAALRMPLVWPEGQPAGGRAAMRVAAYAAERGQAAAFVLAASRLAFCGGFDVDDPEILAEAAAAAALPLAECLAAAGDRSRDAAMRESGRLIVAANVDRLPAIEVDGRLFCGEERLAQAHAAARDTRARQS